MLSNIVLDELDHELEQRGLRSIRYADDFIIFIRSKRSAQRVMANVSNFISRKLKLKVNEEKSQITHPWWMCYLGLSFTSKRGDTKVRIHSKSIKRMKERVREITARKSGQSIHRIVYNLNQYLRGWWNYYSVSQCKSMFRSINGWIMRRLRAIFWKQWKNPRTRIRELRKRGIYGRPAHSTGNSRKGAWRMSRVKWGGNRLAEQIFQP